MKTDEVVGYIERKYIVDQLNKNQRIDGRKFFEFRPITIVPNVIKKAEGSALVKIGDTTVIAGVKLQLGAPFPDTPDDGVFILNVELSPIASPSFESGPPSPAGIEIARVADRAIRESEAIDTKALCVISGEQVWIVFVDVYILDDHGNLIDAVTLASMAALANTKIPKHQIIEENGTKKVELLEETYYLPLNGFVASTTFAKIGKKIVVDPVIDEERIEDARFTIAVTENGMICSMQKGESGTFTFDEISAMLDRAVEIVPNIITQLKDHSHVEELQPLM